MLQVQAEHTCQVNLQRNEEARLLRTKKINTGNVIFRRMKEVSYLLMFMWVTDSRVPTSPLLRFEELGPFQAL